MKNKKLIATVASLCLVLVAVVAAVIGVLAAATQTVSNKFSIKYQANDVNATITAQARAEGGNFSSLLKQNTETVQSITFAKTDPQDQNISAEEFNPEISSTVRYVVYKMSFTNLNTAHGMSVTGTYTFYTSGQGVVADHNVSIWYCWTKDDDLDTTVATAVPSYTASPADTVVAPTATGETFTSLSKGDNATAAISHNLDKSEYIYLYFIVAITNLNEDAAYLLGTSSTQDYSGKAGNTLSFVLARYDAPAQGD